LIVRIDMYRFFSFTFILLISSTLHALEPEKLFEKLSPSVWVVFVPTIEEGKTNIGSAVVIGSEELITNCHVLKNGKSISVKRLNVYHNATLLHADVDRDLCILQASGLAAPAVAIASISSIKVGQRVFSIGAPRALELTLSDGLVSSLIRDKNGNVSDIQISVPISPGSSGGGLFNQDGKLVGISTWGLTESQNLNFARPAEFILDVPRRALIALKERVTKKVEPHPSEEAKSGGPNSPGRQIIGEEIKGRFTNLGTVSGNTPSGANIRLSIDKDGTLNIKNIDRGGYTAGTYRFNEYDNQICFFCYGKAWNMMQTCYHLSEVAPKKMLMQSTSTNYYFTYSEP